MEECCVVCAEPLEWVGYGVCGHRDVCSRCIARLRFVLNDRHCCICKQECSSVFVTKALGNYTKVINDFEILHKSGDYWYDKNTQAFFDNKEHYAMVKAMCRLSCQVCEQTEGAELIKDFVKKGHIFKNLALLQQHLFSVHKLQMCGLCLEGRKIFICEQKLYNKGQLECHSAEGNSDIDGIGEERGGFTGHPLCCFCQRRFYSDHELYQHMSIDHYLCHICQRLHPGQYDYFHNYDDLEVHFRHEHSLCEHPDCLAKKFVVFKTDTELKRHNALTHGGNMSRSERNTYLQIPVSFQYRRPHNFHHGTSNPRNPTNVVNSERREPSASTGYSNTEGNATELSAPTEVLLIDTTSRYRTAAGGNMAPNLEESAFPPLPGVKSTRRKAKQHGRGSSSSANGALQGSDRPSVSSRPWHRIAEDRPCSSSGGSVNLINKQLEVPGKQACSEGVVSAVNVRSAVNIGHTAVDDSESSPMDSFEHGFQLTDEVRCANKALGESIRSRLGDDLELFTAFKDLSAKFRKGKLDVSHYCEHVKGLGLWDLVPELARLCPEPERQKALLNAFEINIKGKQLVTLKETRLGRNLSVHCSNEHEKDCGKAEANEGAAHSIAHMMAALRLRDRGGTSSQDNDGEAQSLDGFCEPEGRHMAGSNEAGSSSSNRDNKPGALLVNGGSHVGIPNQTATRNMWSCGVCTLENSELENNCAACGKCRPTAVAERHGKRKKKMSKFEGLRVDEVSPLCPPSLPPDPAQKKKSGGVWKNGGGQRLVALAQREAIIDSAWSR
ncbi:hypothetical protein L7F22_000823 [Adiantum nelumboides]|nr:hypothetical protein [Adiantum nelumboides]